jgi:hypothetical protein
MPDPLLEYRERLLERLEAVVPELADALAAIPASRWWTPIDGGRSVHAQLAHLRDLERHAALARLRRLLAEDMPSFETWMSPEWDTTLYRPDEPVTDILADYAGLREAELQLLRGLAPADWARAGRHATLGRRTMLWWTERILEYADDCLRILRAQR